MTKRFTVTNMALGLGFVCLGIASASMVALLRSADQAAMPVSALLRPTEHRSASHGTLLFVFRPGDCPSSLDVIEHLNNAFRTGNTMVMGRVLTDHPDTVAVRAVVKSYGIRFPVDISTPADYERRTSQLGRHDIPVTLVFDARRILRHIISSRVDSTDMVSAQVRRYVYTTIGGL